MSGQVQSAPDIAARCRHVVAAITDRKAQDVRVLELGRISSLADYFVVCAGTNERQVQAIADGVLERLKEIRVRPHHIEGHGSGRWILLDYGDFVVHVFEESTRAFYALEKLWADAPDVTAEFVG